ncbi:hypothetical protein [Chroococcus sp. FPU101]|uniref:hypothetical protein n=1 Tax=Chroococcus sp. FPU101 TaxID=1974212 RepID=UPI001A8F4335|nr:hypothetical protein [Chroococcus sp. FPU101]
MNELTEQEMKAIINARYPNLRERIKNEPKEFLIGFLQAVGLHESERFVIPEMDGEPTNPLPKINRRWGGY